MEGEVQKINFILFVSFSSQTPHFGGPGLSNFGLSDDDCLLVQRFNPAKFYGDEETETYVHNLDTIGFFIAKFVKQNCQ